MASLLSFSLPKLAITKATLSSPITSTTTTTPDILEEKFSKKGFKFSESNNIPFVELTVRNGSSLKLQIPNAHVTSYKPRVYWKDEDFTEEVLYTVPGGKGSGMDSRGGIGLVINDVSDSSSKGSLVTASDWTVKDVDSDAIDALQVELSCTSGNLDLTYIVSLYPETMATAVIIKNNGRKAVTLTSAILSHMKFKRRGKAGIKGFNGCSYCPHPPLSSPFELVSPAEAMKSESPGLFDFNSEPEDKLGVWGVQDVPYLIVKKKFSRIYGAHPEERLKDIYNTPPNKYETLDQGRELFFRIIRMGYEDTYIGSPGSLSEKYGQEYFVCTGPAAILVPLVVKPGESWRGAQVIEHDNL